MTASLTTSRPRRGLLWRACATEWAKQRTVRATPRALAASVVLVVGFGAVATASRVAQWSDMSDAQRADLDPVSATLVGVLLSTVVLGAIGVRSIAGEHATGMVLLTNAALPDRRVVLVAKAAVAALVTLPAGLVGTSMAFAAGQAILAREGLGVSVTEPGALRAIAFGSAAGSLVAVAGVGLGALLRRPAAAITVLAVGIIGSQLLSVAVPASLRPYLPGAAIEAIVSVRGPSRLLTPAGGLAALAVVAAATFAAALARADRAPG